jgi:hypothetical protein
MGKLGYASVNNTEEFAEGDWLACAKSLIAYGMPLPPLDRYEFSEEVTDYFESMRDTSDAT